MHVFKWWNRSILFSEFVQAHCFRGQADQTGLGSRLCRSLSRSQRKADAFSTSGPEQSDRNVTFPAYYQQVRELDISREVKVSCCERLGTFEVFQRRHSSRRSPDRLLQKLLQPRRHRLQRVLDSRLQTSGSRAWAWKEDFEKIQNLEYWKLCCDHSSILSTNICSENLCFDILTE